MALQPNDGAPPAARIFLPDLTALCREHAGGGDYDGATGGGERERERDRAADIQPDADRHKLQRELEEGLREMAGLQKRLAGLARDRDELEERARAAEGAKERRLVEQLQDKLLRDAQDRNALQAQAAAQAAEVDRLGKRLEGEQRLREDSQRAIDQLRADLREAEEKAAADNKSLARKKDEERDLRSQVEQLRERLVAQGEQALQQREREHGLQNQVEQLRLRIADLEQAALADERSILHFRDQERALRVEVDQLRTKVGLLENQGSQDETRLSKVQDVERSLRDELTRERHRSKQLEDALGRDQQQLSSLKDNEAVLKRKLALLEEVMDDVNRLRDELERHRPFIASSGGTGGGAGLVCPHCKSALDAAASPWLGGGGGGGYAPPLSHPHSHPQQLPIQQIQQQGHPQQSQDPLQLHMVPAPPSPAQHQRPLSPHAVIPPPAAQVQVGPTPTIPGGAGGKQPRSSRESAISPRRSQNQSGSGGNPWTELSSRLDRLQNKLSGQLRPPSFPPPLGTSVPSIPSPPARSASPPSVIPGISPMSNVSRLSNPPTSAYTTPDRTLSPSRGGGGGGGNLTPRRTFASL